MFARNHSLTRYRPILYTKKHSFQLSPVFPYYNNIGTHLGSEIRKTTFLFRSLYVTNKESTFNVEPAGVYIQEKFSPRTHFKFNLKWVLVFVLFSMRNNLKITTLVFFAPCLAFLHPFFLTIMETTLGTLIENW